MTIHNNVKDHCGCATCKGKSEELLKLLKALEHTLSEVFEDTMSVTMILWSDTQPNPYPMLLSNSEPDEVLKILQYVEETFAEVIQEDDIGDTIGNA